MPEAEPATINSPTNLETTALNLSNNQTPWPTKIQSPTPSMISGLITPTRNPTSSTTPMVTIKSSQSSTPTTGLITDCPQINPDLKPDFIDLLSEPFPQLEKPILEYLNAGGTWSRLLDAFSWNDQNFLEDYAYEGDLTGDGKPEWIISRNSLFIFGCQNGSYQTLLRVPPGIDAHRRTPTILAVTDMNQDLFPEVVVQTAVLGGLAGSTNLVQVFEETYQFTTDLSRACSSAVEAAEKQPEMLGFLGDAYHGVQDAYYHPGDVCPFSPQANQEK